MSEDNNYIDEPKKGEILLYQTENGKTKIDVTILDDTVWLSQYQLVELFGSSKSNISEHISNILGDGELDVNSVVRNFRITASDGKLYRTNYYNLEMIIFIGYRVRSNRGAQFRVWATERLREYIIKGFTMNDDLLKNNGMSSYFDELLRRIRDIRSSEKVFYRKVLDIFSTSIDYNSKADMCRGFFKIIQNKFHYSVHQHTASELIFERANADDDNMGLTHFAGKTPTKAESHIAKNYLTVEELDRLNRMVTIYLEFAELQAINKQVIYMNDHLLKVDEILKMTGGELLSNAGKISSKKAFEKADVEYDKFMKDKDLLSIAEKDMIASIEKKVTLLEKSNKKK